MAGLAARGLQHDEVVGQSAGLFTFQICNHRTRSECFVEMDFMQTGIQIEANRSLAAKTSSRILLDGL